MICRLFCSPQICIVHRPFYSPQTVKIVCRLVAASTHWTLLRHQPSSGSILSSMASVRWTYFIVDLRVDRWPATAGLSPRVMMLSLCYWLVATPFLRNLLARSAISYDVSSSGAMRAKVVCPLPISPSDLTPTKELFQQTCY